ncbi:MAG: 16S rRNA (adenine(1518)-N(6)/adenine(1519)-N(6))-dimethyltransferase RsmA [Nitrospiraceae bacterium]|nr:16S rRNA (adenine(1518)-N(6)/adenine(1519)-N(6))-dimethyltransferase RsmA [Nitrospiraceae bacterium]
MTERIQAKKSLGQNFLKDPHYLSRIAEAAHIAPDSQVIEIGPGMGDLTRELLRRAGKLLLIELDDRLIPLLRKEFGADPRVTIVHADAMEFDFRGLSGTWSVVANLPYYVATPLIQRMLLLRGTLGSLTLMLQQEVADRICAAPGGKEYGYLSVISQMDAVPRKEFSVPPAAFQPTPKVFSAVITLSLRPESLVPDRDRDLFVRMIKAGFSLRRKTLRNALGQLGIPSDAWDGIATASGIDPRRRAETLSIAEFLRLLAALQPYVQSPSS